MQINILEVRAGYVVLKTIRMGLVLSGDVV